jgi:hypothetical protein
MLPSAPPQDKALSQLQVSQTLVSNIFAGFRTSFQVLYLENNNTTFTYHFAPKGPETYYKLNILDAKFVTSVGMNDAWVINTTVDSSQSKIGDQMTWMFQNKTPNEIKVIPGTCPWGTENNTPSCYPQDFLFWPFPFAADSKITFTWIFNGTKWTYSQE